MSQQLAVYNGSRQGSQYDIILGNDGVTYCTCPGWKNRKNCKHLLDWTLNKGQMAATIHAPIGPALDNHDELIQHPSAVFEDDSKMNDAISMAINMMKG